MCDREMCQAAYQQMYRAMIAKDIPALSQVLDEAFYKENRWLIALAEASTY